MAVCEMMDTMTGFEFSFRGKKCLILPSGALFWPNESLLCVSDLHLGKSARIARRGGAILPPYETRDTLDRLARDIAITQAHCVVSLGDGFDDVTAAHDLPAQAMQQLATLTTGRDWVWIAGNHDPGPTHHGGIHVAEFIRGPLTFRHIAQPSQAAEISGHYHPKVHMRVRGRTLHHRCVLVNRDRIVLPAYGTYTGGMPHNHPVLSTLIPPPGRAIVLTGGGAIPVAIPLVANTDTTAVRDGNAI